MIFRKKSMKTKYKKYKRSKKIIGGEKSQKIIEELKLLIEESDKLCNTKEEDDTAQPTAQPTTQTTDEDDIAQPKNVLENIDEVKEEHKLNEYK